MYIWNILIFMSQSKSDGHDLQEVLSCCSKPQLDNLWEDTQQKCATTFMSLEIGDDEQMQEVLHELIIRNVSVLPSNIYKKLFKTWVLLGLSGSRSLHVKTAQKLSCLNLLFWLSTKVCFLYSILHWTKKQQMHLEEAVGQ